MIWYNVLESANKLEVYLQIKHKWGQEERSVKGIGWLGMTKYDTVFLKNMELFSQSTMEAISPQFGHIVFPESQISAVNIEWCLKFILTFFTFDIWVYCDCLVLKVIMSLQREVTRVTESLCETKQKAVNKRMMSNTFSCRNTKY